MPPQKQNFDLFLSYNSRDHEQVEDLARRLRQHRLTLFFDRWYLAPGLRWRPTLEDTLTSCRAVVVCVGPNGMGTWQQREIDVALDRQSRDAQFPVIPLLLPGSEAPLGFLRQLTWVDLRNQPLEQGVLVLTKAIRGEPLGKELQQQIEATRAAICPYRGLLYFREEDAPFFFGRDAAIGQLVEAVGQKGFLAVVGASGSGKSSVVRAGLVPQVRRDRDTCWEVVTLLPGEQPLRSLAAALTPFLEPEMTEIDRLAEVGKLSAYFAAGTVSLGDVIQRILAKQSGTDRVLLVVDQCEELYTLTQDDAPRRRFVDELLNATASTPVTVVLTLRGDFVGKALTYRLLSDRLQGAQINLGPMTRAELEQAVTQPAQQVGLCFEPGLAERILDDTGDEPGNLPLLEFVLKELWEARRGPLLQNQAYDDMDRLSGAIAKRAERFFGALTGPEQEAVRRLFLQLVHPGEANNDTRRREPLVNLPDTSRQLVQRLADERLIVTAKAEEVLGETAEVAHEALIRNWSRLRNWLNADHEFLLRRERVRDLLGEWQRAGENEELLLRGPLLTEAEGWLRERADRLTSAEQTFITSSVETCERRRQEERQRQQKELEQARALAVEKARREEAQRTTRVQRRYTRVALALSIACALLGVGLGIAWLAAQRGTRTALADKLALRAQALLGDGQLDRALVLSAQAVRLHDSGENVAAARECLVHLKRRVQSLPDHNDLVRSVAFRPGGTMLASGSRDRSVRLWDLNTARCVWVLKGHADEVDSVAFSPNGKILASGGRDKTVRFWNPDTRQLLGILNGHQDEVDSVAFSPDGKVLAAGSRDHMVRLWTVETQQALEPPLIGHTGQVSSLAFSPDGEILASGGRDNMVWLWDMEKTHPSGTPLPRHDAEIWTVAFSPDSNTLAAGSIDGTIRLWNVKTHEPLGEPLVGHGSEIWSVAFSPDGKTLAAGGLDGTIRLWDVARRKPQGEPLVGHSREVWSVAFSPDGQTLASGGGDRTVRLWDVGTRPPLGEPLAGHTAEVWNVAFSPDGKTLASGSADKTVRFWDVARGQPADPPLTDPNAQLWNVAFSPDGRMLASGTDDNAVRLWDLTTRRPVGMAPQRQGSYVCRVAFSPDGKTLVSGSGDKTVTFWTMEAQGLSGEPPVGCNTQVWSVALSPDGKMLAWGGEDGAVRLWDVETRRPLSDPLVGHSRQVWSVAFSPGGKTLASGSIDKTVRLWNVEKRRCLGAPLVGHTADVYGVAFSPDGETLASGGRDNTVRLWDVQTGRQLGPPLTGHKAEVYSVAFSPDGTTLASSSRDYTVRLWRIEDRWLQFVRHVAIAPPLALMDEARRMANRELSEEEVQEYFGDLARFYEPLWKDHNGRKP
jgi:WD40 repeat protein